MINETCKKKAIPGLLQLLPFFVFLSLFLGSMIFFSTNISPVFACLVATFVSFFTFLDKRSINEKIKLFIQGSARPHVITICYIFIFISAFSYALKTIGGFDAIIRIGLWAIPLNFILPGFFIVVSFFALGIGSSLGAIAAFLPLGLTIAQKIGASPALISGIVVSGAMLGDNLSIISDTTIAATQMVGAKMTDKFKANVLLVLPAFFMTVITLCFINAYVIDTSASIPVQQIQGKDFIFLVPYLLILVLTMAGLDVIMVILAALFFVIGTGVWFEHFSFLEGTKLVVQGFANNEGGIAVMVVYVMCKSGLTYIVEHNGGVTYIIEKFSIYVKNRGQAEVTISLLMVMIDAAVAVAAISILVAGPIARQFSKKFNIAPRRMACLLDIFSTLSQSILPYGAILMLASSIANISPLSITKHLYYQGFLLIVMAGSITATFFKDAKLQTIKVIPAQKDTTKEKQPEPADRKQP